MYNKKSLDTLFKKFGQVQISCNSKKQNVCFKIKANRNKTLRLSVIRRFKLCSRVFILVNAVKKIRFCSLIRSKKKHCAKVLACWRMDKVYMKFLSKKYIFTKRMIHYQMKNMRVIHNYKYSKSLYKYHTPKLPKKMLKRIGEYYAVANGKHF